MSSVFGDISKRATERALQGDRQVHPVHLFAALVDAFWERGRDLIALHDLEDWIKERVPQGIPENRGGVSWVHYIVDRGGECTVSRHRRNSLMVYNPGGEAAIRGLFETVSDYKTERITTQLQRMIFWLMDNSDQVQTCLDELAADVAELRARIARA